MEKKKQYEASYAGYVYTTPATYWTAENAVKKHLKKVDLTGTSEIQAGGLPIISDGKTAYIDASDGHTAILAASGMKKSICGFMPLISIVGRAGENMVITDPKGELYDCTSGFLASQGYKIFCLDFRTLDKDCFNILRHPAEVYRSGEQDRGLSLLSDIVSTLTEEQKKVTKELFWHDTAVMWLNGTGAIMLDAYPRINQVNVLNWSDCASAAGAASLQKLLVCMPENTAKVCLKQCLSSAENTFRSILVTVASALSIFNQNPRLAAMLSHSSFTLEDLLKPKTALYLVTDDTTSTADPILGIIISQIQSFLVNQAYLCQGGKLQTRMNFILDEFASLPIQDMDKALATHRSRNIRYYLCVQSLAQLRQRYGNPAALLANCESILYMGSTETELLAELETKLGRTRITPDGSERPLCSQAELMTLKKTWSHKEAIYMNLSGNIRYCAMLPSIEAYDLGTQPAVRKAKTKIADVDTYSVSDYVKDALDTGKAHVPFVSVKKSLSGRYPVPEPPCSAEEEDYFNWNKRRRRMDTFSTASGNKN